jgi:hypothetical protein
MAAMSRGVRLYGFEVRGRREVAAVRVHRLSEQRHLTAAFGHQRAHLGHDCLRRVAALAAAGARDHAERAVLLAALHHRDVRLQAAGRRRARGDLDERRLRGVHQRPPLAPDARHELAHPRHRRRAEHEIDVRRPLLDGALLELRHAAHHAEHNLRSLHLERTELAQLGEDLVLGLLADRAGVHEDEIGVGGVLGQLVALLAKQAGHPLRVVLVHLTAVGDDV